jgi:hypothetical protein
MITIQPMETITQLFKVLWAPRKVMAEIAQRPRLIAPLLFLTLFAVAETAIVLAKLDPGELRLQEFERGGYADKISESDKAYHAAAARSYRTMLAAFTVTRWVSLVLITGGVFYLLLGMGRGIPLKPFLAVTAFAFIPAAIRSIAMIATVLTAEPTTETLSRAGAISPIRLVDPASVSRTLYQALGMVDVITLWILALLVIGYGYVLRDRVSPVFRVSAVVGAYLLLGFIWVYIIPAMA